MAARRISRSCVLAGPRWPRGTYGGEGWRGGYGGDLGRHGKGAWLGMGGKK